MSDEDQYEVCPGCGKAHEPHDPNDPKDRMYREAIFEATHDLLVTFPDDFPPCPEHVGSDWLDMECAACVPSADKALTHAKCALDAAMPFVLMLAAAEAMEGLTGENTDFKMIRVRNGEVVPEPEPERDPHDTTPEDDLSQSKIVFVSGLLDGKLCEWEAPKDGPKVLRRWCEVHESFASKDDPSMCREVEHRMALMEEAGPIIARNAERHAITELAVGQAIREALNDMTKEADED